MKNKCAINRWNWIPAFIWASGRGLNSASPSPKKLFRGVVLCADGSGELRVAVHVTHHRQVFAGKLVALPEVDSEPRKRLPAEASGGKCRVRTDGDFRDGQPEQFHRSLEAGVHSLSADVPGGNAALVGDEEKSVPCLDPGLQNLPAAGEKLHVVRLSRVNLPAARGP